MYLAWFRVARLLEDGKEGGEEVDLDAGDGGMAEQAIFDLGGELDGGGLAGCGGVEGDGCDEAWGEAGDMGAGGVGVGGEGGGADEAGGDDVGAGGGVAVAEEVEEFGVGHECEASFSTVPSRAEDGVWSGGLATGFAVGCAGDMDRSLRNLFKTARQQRRDRRRNGGRAKYRGLSTAPRKERAAPVEMTI